MKETGMRIQLLGRRCHWLLRFRSLFSGYDKISPVEGVRISLIRPFGSQEQKEPSGTLCQECDQNYVKKQQIFGMSCKKNT